MIRIVSSTLKKKSIFHYKKIWSPLVNSVCCYHLMTLQDHHRIILNFSKSSTQDIFYQQIYNFTEFYNMHINNMVDKSTESEKNNNINHSEIKKLDWTQVEQFIERNPPNTLDRILNLLLLGKKVFLNLKIQSSLQKLNIQNQAEVKIGKLVAFYNLTGYNMFQQAFKRAQIQLKRRLQKNTTIVLKQSQINNILEVRYHRKKLNKLKYLDNYLPLILIPHIQNIVPQLDTLKISYYTLYLLSEQLQYQLGIIYQRYVRGKNPINLFLTQQFVNQYKPSIQTVSDQRIITNFLACQKFINKCDKLNRITQKIINFLDIINQDDIRQSFGYRMLYQNSQINLLYNKNVISDVAIKKIINILVNYYKGNNINKAEKFIKLINQYPRNILPLEKILNIIIKVDKQNLFLSGYQFLILNKVQIKKSINFIINKQKIHGQHQQIRLYLILKQIKDQKYNTYINNIQKKLEQYLVTVPHIVLDAIQKTTLKSTQGYQDLLNKISQLLLRKVKVLGKLNDFQYFRLLSLLCRSKSSHAFIIQNLKGIVKNQVLLKKLIAAFFNISQQKNFDKNWLDFILILLQNLKIHPDLFINYILQNRSLQMRLLLNTDIQKLYELLEKTKRMDTLLKFGYFMKLMKMENYSRYMKLLLTNKNIMNFKQWYQLINKLKI